VDPVFLPIRSHQVKPYFTSGAVQVVRSFEIRLVRRDVALAGRRLKGNMEPDHKQQQRAGAQTSALPQAFLLADLPTMLETGLQHHRAGRLAEAERVYGQVLALDANHADALHLLGAIAHQTGQYHIAVATIGKAIEIKPEIAAYHTNLGTALKALGRLDDAIAAYKKAIACKPDFAEAHANLGNVLKQAGRADEAVAAYSKAISYQPDFAEAHANLGNTLQVLGQLNEAIAAYNNAIRLKPDDAHAHSNLGNALRASGQLDKAIAAYSHAIHLKPDFAEAHFNLGATFNNLEQFDEAIAAYNRAIGLKPDFAEAYSNLGNALRNSGRLDEAVAAYENAIRLKPDFAEAHSNLGNVLKDLGRFEDALASYDKAIRLKPDFAEVYSNLSNALQDLGRLDEAVAACKEAIHLKPAFADAHSNLGNALKNLGQLKEAIAAHNTAIGYQPDYAQGHFNLGIALLLAGAVSNGWAEYEWRWRKKEKQSTLRRFAKPQWQGEEVNGRTVLLHAEQGLGDTIQFCRYAALIAARGARVLLQIPRSLLRLLSGLHGVERLIAVGDPIPAFDFHCPLMSLPHIFGTNLATIPAPFSYMPVDEAKRRHWQQRLSAPAGRRVGLVWAGNPQHGNDRNRSLPFAALAPLWNIPGIRWYSLQVGERRADLDAAPPGVIEDLSPFLDDFAETAAAISQLDLVLTVDTSVAHLAGAIGHPTWVMLPFIPDWRSGKSSVVHGQASFTT
jgi:tetratricopeptide (TPR) repeat protein